MSQVSPAREHKNYENSGVGESGLLIPLFLNFKSSSFVVDSLQSGYGSPSVRSRCSPSSASGCDVNPSSASLSSSNGGGSCLSASYPGSWDTSCYCSILYSPPVSYTGRPVKHCHRCCRYSSIGAVIKKPPWKPPLCCHLFANASPVLFSRYLIYCVFVVFLSLIQVM